MVKTSEEFGLRKLDVYPPIEQKGSNADEIFNDSDDEGENKKKASTENGENNLAKLDLLCFGVVLLEVITEKPLVTKLLPQLTLLLKRRGLSNLIRSAEDEDFDVLEKENSKLMRILEKEEMHRNDQEADIEKQEIQARKVHSDTSLLKKARRLSVSLVSRNSDNSSGSKSNKSSGNGLGKMMRRASMIAKLGFSSKESKEKKSVSEKKKGKRDIKELDLVQITSTDEYAIDPLVKKEVRSYLKKFVDQASIQKPNWLISMEELILNLLTTVEESRPTSKAVRNWMLEILQSYSKSQLKHEELKKLLDSQDLTSKNVKETKAMEFSETMKRGGEGNYIDYFYLYELFYSTKVAQNLMTVLLDVSPQQNVFIYHSKDFVGDIPDDASVDSFMPPKTMEEAMKEAQEEVDHDDFASMDEFGIHRKEEVAQLNMPKKESKKSDRFPGFGNTLGESFTRKEFKLDNGLGVLKDKPPPINPKLIGKKADKILNNMDQERQEIGKILKTKEIVKYLDDQKKVPHENIVSLLKRAKDILSKEDNLLVINAPCIVVGDIHGQYFDIRQVMRFCGTPSKKKRPSVALTRKRQKKLVRQITRSSIKKVSNRVSKTDARDVKAAQLLARTVRISAGNLLQLRNDQLSDNDSDGGTTKADQRTSKREKVGKGKTFLFLGDYVDRGHWSCEVLFYLLSLKVEYPESVIMLRGNHECDAMADTYGFREECERKYGREVYHRCLHVFNALPIGCIINLPDNRRFFACHGGISDKVTTLEQIGTLDRFREPGIEGTLCDILWSDPVPDDVLETPNLGITDDFKSIRYLSNETRGCAKKFGYLAIEDFLKKNKLVGLIRAHEAKEEGFQFHFQNAGSKDHLCVTVFSSPDYMAEHGNKGAVLIIHESVKDRLKHQMQRLNFEYTEEQILRQQDAEKDDYLDLLEPICYHEVTQPEPAYFEDQNWNLVKQIEELCPYMPTTIEDFYNSSLDILDRYGNAKAQMKALQKQEQEKAQKVATDMLEFEKMREKRKKKSVNKSSRQLKRYGTSKEAIQHRLKKEENKTKKFSRTVKKINEVHPGVMSEKLRAAGSKLERLEQVAAVTSSTREIKDMTLKKGVDNRQEEEKSLQKFFDEVQGRSFMWREKVEMENRDYWLDFVCEWFSILSGESIYSEGLCEALGNCILLCYVVSLVADKPGLKYSKADEESGETMITTKLNAFEIRQNLLVFQDVCKELGIKHMFFVSDIDTQDLNYILPALVELALKARSLGRIEDSLAQLLEEEIWTRGLGSEINENEGEWRTKDIEVGNVTFNSQERLILQLLFLMIDRDDTGFLTYEGVVTWAKEEGKFIRQSHAKKVISAIDYDGDKAVGLRDFFQYASRLKEDYNNDLESLEGYETPESGYPDDDEFQDVEYENENFAAHTNTKEEEEAMAKYKQEQMQTINLQDMDFEDATSEESGEYFDAQDEFIH
eukprot:augustus_masked-scaffold_32-processed-gene-1.0-mRNA-1 protein AED:0.35 eAED:0.37 QI:0/-1/0/1/-1/1/1/0/1451